MTYEECMGYTNECTDWSKSVKLILGDNIIGCYLIKEAELPEFKDKKGIEGVALCILPEYRGKGYGEKMKDWLENYAKSHDYDYIYGMHLKTLKNIEPWLKRRELYKEDEELYHTIKWIK
jgi:GNAT superfamily N-acetyltransferase